MEKKLNRNHLVVGKNSMSYDDKHPENPVSLRPVHDAIQKLPKLIGKSVFDMKPDHGRIELLRALGTYLPRPSLIIHIESVLKGARRSAGFAN